MPPARDTCTRDGPSLSAAGVKLSAPGWSRILSQLLAGGKSNKQKDKWRARKRGENKRGKEWDLFPPIFNQPSRCTQHKEVHVSHKEMENARLQKAQLSSLPRSACISSLPGSFPETSASVIPPPHLIISPSSIYGPLSALFSLHPHTHSSNWSSPP